MNIRSSTEYLEDIKVLPSHCISKAMYNTSGSALNVVTQKSLSVSPKCMKNSSTGQVPGLRHRNMIEKHMLKAEELGKIRKSFHIASRNVVKRWFVLYDDSQKHVGRGGNDEGK